MFDSLKERFENIFSSLRGKGKLSEEDINLALREVRRALIEADVNYKVVKDVVEAIRARATARCSPFCARTAPPTTAACA